MPEFRTTFTTSYQQHADREGQPFTVLAFIDQADAEHNAETLPTYRADPSGSQRPLRASGGLHSHTSPGDIMHSLKIETGPARPARSARRQHRTP
jgi:hypothetical protein